MEPFLCPWAQNCFLSPPLLIQTPLTSNGAAPIVTWNPGQSDGRSRGFGDSEAGLVRGNCEGKANSPHHNGGLLMMGARGTQMGRRARGWVCHLLGTTPTPAYSPHPLASSSIWHCCSTAGWFPWWLVISLHSTTLSLTQWDFYSFSIPAPTQARPVLQGLTLHKKVDNDCVKAPSVGSRAGVVA